MMVSTFTKHFLLIFSAPIIWMTHFFFVYVYTAIICARPPLQVQWLGIGIVEWGVGAAGIAAVLAIALIHMRTWRAGIQASDAAFVRWAGAGLGLLAILAIVYESIPMWLVPACG